ncbi:matrix metalloproteinase-19 [Engraulis encrasicolus]|uniref:matrix metalloproteinase-19 n=1 Tax=Engraulis encrasicolus TaxID=184585 RepID=UPI002FD5DF88
MACLFRAVVILASICCTTSLTVMERRDQFVEATNYLKKYGYLSIPLDPHVEPDLSSATVEEALRVFQRISNLHITGRIDRATIERMRGPRCGVEDPFNNKSMRYRRFGGVWRKRSLTYRIHSYTPDLGKEGTQRAIRSAFKYWSDVTPLSFKEVSYGRADLRISFHDQSTVVCNSPFDGRGVVLAHAEAPPSGMIHFDLDEQWTEGKYSGTNLRIVAAHEIGHALGLGHSQYSTALMAPHYRGYNPNFRLHSDDVRGIQSMYGARETDDSNSVDKAPPTTAPAPIDTPDPCTARLDAIILGPWRKTFAFSGDYFWTVTDAGYQQPIRINLLWKSVPGHINAAVHSPRTNKTYFFKGNKFWRYTGLRLDYGYPKQLTKLSPNIDAALYLEKNKKLVFIKGSQYWQWDEISYTDMSVYPKPLSNLFTGVPSNPDAAFTWKNSKIYLFKGQKYWRLNNQLRVESGYPLSIKERWMQCNY